ncbi:MAG: DUF6320 domain-containing protein [Clostridiales bacterium]|nr:DUF6320 domain-containing protein [Clostridiales bacterium]
MGRCAKCNVEILDDTERCPLCGHVLERGEESKTKGLYKDNTDKMNDSELINDMDRSDMGNEQIHYFVYPDARVYVRGFRFLENLLLFLSIVVGTVLMGFNFGLTENPEFPWSVIVILVLVYVNVLLRLAVLGRSGYRFKTFSMVILALAILIAIDYLTGYQGWAVAYVIPAAIILMDVGILVVMIVNFRNWQSYMVVQMIMILRGILSLVLVIISGGDDLYPAIVALVASAFLFLGTLILGDKRAREELKRRFYI